MRTLSGTWPARLAGAHDAVNEVVYLAQAVRPALPNRSYSALYGFRYHYYVHTKIAIGRVGTCGGAEDAWGDRYMEGDDGESCQRVERAQSLQGFASSQFSASTTLLEVSTLALLRGSAVGG